MSVHAECYGHLFPPVATLANDRDIAGAVFRYRIEQPGPISTERSVGVDESAWDRCTQCEEFETCYCRSLGSLLMDLAVRA